MIDTVQTQIRLRSKMGVDSNQKLKKSFVEDAKNKKNGIAQYYSTAPSEGHSTPCRGKTLDSVNESQEFITESVSPKGQQSRQQKTFNTSLFDCRLHQNVVNIHIVWPYGGQEVFLVGSFTGWDFMIKMN